MTRLNRISHLKLSDVAWPAVEAGGAAMLAIVSSFVVARVVGPAELGIAATIVSAHVLLWVVVNALFADAVVQHADIDHGALSAAFWASTSVGVAMMAVQVGCGWGLAWLMDDDRLLAMAMILAVSLPLVGGAGVVQGILTRNRAYRWVALRTLIGNGIGTCFGIVASVHGLGAWAIVGQQSVSSGVGALVLIVFARWSPALVWRWSSVRALLRVGLPLTAGTLILLARYRVFAILLGANAGAAALGQVHIAFRLVDTVRDVSFTALWRLFLPDLSRYQHDRDAMLVCVDRLLRLSSMIMLPLCGGLVVSLVPFVALALGPEWQEAGKAAIPLVVLMAALAVTFPSGVALVAAGQPRLPLYANLAALVATSAGVVIWQPQTAREAIVIWCASQVLVIPYVAQASARALGVGLLRPLREAVPMTLLTGLAVFLSIIVPDRLGLAATPGHQLGWQLAVGGAVLGGGLGLHCLLLPRFPIAWPFIGHRPPVGDQHPP